MRYFYLLISTILLGYCGQLNAQATFFEWAVNATTQNPAGGFIETFDVATDASGNRYVTGYFSNSADFDPGTGMAIRTATGNNDCFVAKYDAAGLLLWVTSVGGGFITHGKAIAVDPTGNVYVTGLFYGTADFDGSAGVANLSSLTSQSAFIMKYNTNGTYIWAKGLTGTGEVDGNDIGIDAGGNVFVTGKFANDADFDPSAAVATHSASNISNAYIAKYTNNGLYIWAKSFGGTFEDIGKSLITDPSGAVVVTGTFQDTVDFNPAAPVATLTATGTRAMFIARFDAIGNYIWAKAILGNAEVLVQDIGVDGGNNIFVTGYFDGTADFDPAATTANHASAGGSDIFIAKYSSAGLYSWSKKIGGINNDEGHALGFDTAQNVYVTGKFMDTVDFNADAGVANFTSVNGNDVFITKYNNVGVYVVTKQIAGNGAEGGAGLAVRSNVVSIVGNFNQTCDFNPDAGIMNITAPAGVANVFLGSYTSAVALLAAGAVGNLSPMGLADIGTAIEVDANRNSFVTGYFSGTTDFDPGAGTTTLVSAGSVDIFLAKYDGSGNFLWAKGFGAASDDLAYDLDIDSAGNVYITGEFTGTVDFDLSSALGTMTTAGRDVFIAKYDNNGNYLWAIQIGNNSHVTEVRSIALDNGGAFYITGILRGTADFDPSAATADLVCTGSPEIYLAKYDQLAGGYLWAKRVEGTESGEGKAVAVDNTGNVYITGAFWGDADFDMNAGTATLTSEGGEDLFLAKYDTSGNYIWANRVGNGANSAGEAMAFDSSNNLYLTGYVEQITDLDPGVGVDSQPGLGAYDVLLSKYDLNGNYIWGKRLGGGTSEQGHSLKLDTNRNIYITGDFSNTADFDPSAATASFTSNGQNDIFLAKYDTDGNYIWAGAFGGTGFDSGRGLALLGAEIFTTGYYQATVDFDITGIAYNLTSSNDIDVFVSKHVQCITADTPTVAADVSSLCTAGNATLTITGGNLFTAANWKWYDDSCGGNNVGTGNSITVNPSVTTTYYVRGEGGCGGLGQCASVTITVGDITAPTAPTLTDVTAECSATPTAPTATDTCAGTITGTTSTSFPVTAQGTTVVTWSFNDGNGNTSTATQNVIITDTTAPAAPTLSDVTGQCSAAPTAPIAMDNCLGMVTGTTATILPITTQGTTVVTWSFDDGNGNISTTTQNVIITDTTAPAAPTLSDVTGQCAATPSTPNAFDDCAGTIAGTTATVFPITTQGTTVVTWSFDDGLGNISTTTQNVIITDTNAPNAPSSIATEMGECSATPTAPTANDDCAGIITGTTSTAFPITAQGLTVVTWSFNDGNGNTSTVTQNVMVSDVTAPTVPALADVTAQCDATLATPIATDNCTAGPIVGTTSTVFPITAQGATVVTWSFNDGNGNVITANQNVTIVDNIAPVAPTLSDVTAACSATPGIPTATDNCTGIITGTTSTSFPITAQGTTVVTWTFSDGNGNGSTATQNVIITDTTAPAAPTLTDVTAQCSATVTTPTANDACAGTITGTTSTSFPITTQGTTVVTWSFNDGNGNTSTATQNVIITDTTAPAAPTLTDVTGQCSATVSAPTAIDTCAGTITGTTSTSFPITAQGTTVVTWSFNDGNGNTSTTTQNVILTNTTDTTVTVSGTTLTANATGLSYQWVDCANGNMPIPLAIGQSFTPTVDGNYAVIITENGCDSLSACNVVLSTKDNSFVSGVKLYPNPTTGDFTIMLPASFGEAVVRITDMLGKQIQYRTFSQQQELPLSLESVASGVYFVQLQAGEQTAIFKVIKK